MANSSANTEGDFHQESEWTEPAGDLPDNDLFFGDDPNKEAPQGRPTVTEPFFKCANTQLEGQNEAMQWLHYLAIILPFILALIVTLAVYALIVREFHNDKSTFRAHFVYTVGLIS